MYIGPYAMWVGPWDRDPEPSEAAAFEAFDTECGSNGEAEIEPGGPAVRVAVFTPKRGGRRNGPRRVIFYDEEPAGRHACLDLGAIDREAEVAAFRRAYARDLRVLAAVAGSEPVIRWGVVFSCDS